MLKKSKSSRLNNEKGMAIFELIPILVVIVLFVNFSLGFFGAIHTGILNSIAARNYTFETFRNRTDLVYFKNTTAGNVDDEFSKAGMRVHGTISENASGAERWMASTRTIDFFNFQKRAADIVGTKGDHTTGVRDLSEGRNTKVGVNPIWIKTSYGICLNSACGS